MTTKSKPADDQPELQLQNEILDFNTCILHQLQRSVLYSIGLAGSKSRNPEAKELIMMSAL